MILADHGCGAAMIDLGGDIALGDPPPDREGWRIQLPAEPPTGELSSQNAASTPEIRTLHHCGVATSGDAFQHLEIDGHRFSHIVDPRTGQATTHSLTVTVIAKNAMIADGLASAVSVLGVEAGQAHIDKTPDSQAIILQKPANPPNAPE